MSEKMNIISHTEHGSTVMADICGLCLGPGATKDVCSEYWPGQRQPKTQRVHLDCELAEAVRAYSAMSDSERIEARLESAYWRFDARRSGYREWKGAPMSERDAFKAVLRQEIK